MKIAIVDYGVGNRMSVRLAMERLGAETVLTRNASDLQSADAVILPGVGAAGVAIAVLEEAGLMQLLPQLKQPVLGICLGMQLMAGFLWEDEVHGLGIVPAKADFLGKLAAGAAGVAGAAGKVGVAGGAGAAGAVDGACNAGAAGGTGVASAAGGAGIASAASVVGAAGGAGEAVQGTQPEDARIPNMGWAPIWRSSWAFNNSVSFADPILEGVQEGEAFYFAHSYALNFDQLDSSLISAVSIHGSTAFPSVIRSGNFWGCQFHPEKSGGAGNRILRNFLSQVSIGPL